MTMANYGPILKTPRIIRSENEVPMKRSGSMTPSTYSYDGGRRTPVSSVGPRSRSSYGYSVSEIGRDGSLVTRNVSTPSYSSRVASTQYYSTPPTGRPLYAKRGRSMSIEPVSYYYAAPSQSSLYSNVDHSGSSIHSRRVDYSTPDYDVSPVRRESYRTYDRHVSPARGVSYSTYDSPVSPVRGVSYSTYDSPVSPVRGVSYSTYDRRDVSPVRGVSYSTYDRHVSPARGLSYSTYDSHVSPAHGVSYSTYDHRVSPVRGMSYSTYDRRVSPVRKVSHSTYDRPMSPVRRVSYSTFDHLTSPVRRVAYNSYQPGHHTPASYYYTVPTYTETYNSANRSASPVRRASFSYQSTPSMPRLTRRESISQPYYTVNNSSPLGAGELILRRTSISSVHEPAAPRKAVRSFSVASQLSPEGKVLAESNVVTRRTSVQREDLEDLNSAEAGRRTSQYRSGTPSMVEQQKRFSHQHEIGKRSSVVRSVASRDNRSLSVSRPSSMVVNLTSRGSLSLPQAPIRKISVVSKSPEENESASSIKIVDVEGIQFVKKPVFENAEPKNGPRRNEVYEDLKKRTLQAKDRLGRHRMMLDRYLPVKMGPEPDVAFEIQNKYGELVERLPFIERKNPAEVEEEEKENVIKLNIVKPYSPASVKSFSSPFYNVHVPSSFTPTISDTRKRARDVLCRVKGDPEYFNYH